MPFSVVAAIAANAIAGAIASTVMMSAFTTMVLRAAIGFVISGVLRAAIGSDKPKQDIAQPVINSEGRLVTVRQPVAARQVIVGQVRTGGVLTFAYLSESKVTFSLVITLAGHACEEIGDIYFDNELVPIDGSDQATGRFAGVASVTKNLGTIGSQPFPSLVGLSNGAWTDAHRQEGCAKIFVHLQASQDLYPTGVPNITAVVKGDNTIYDPRDLSTGWSDNPALWIAHYLCNADYGLGAVYADEIDEDDLVAAANVCDELVTLADGSSEKRYRVNGAFLTSAAPKEIIGLLAGAMQGKVVCAGGKWHIHAGAYETPTVELDESDLAGPIKVQALLSRRDGCNGVKGTFVNPDANWQPMDFPAVASAAYIAEDNNERVWRDVDLTPFVTSGTQAQRIAKIELLRTRQGLSITLPCKLTAWAAMTGRTFAVTNTKFGWSSKAFELISSRFTVGADGALGVELTARETASAVYDWSTSEEQAIDLAPNTNLPNPFDIATPHNVVAHSGTDELLLGGDGTILSRIRVRWDAPADGSITAGGGVVLVRFKPATSSLWQDVAPIQGDLHEMYIAGVQDGVLYDIGMRFMNALGVRGEEVQIQHTVVGKTAAPSDVEQFTIEGSRLSWTPVADADVIGYRLRYQPGVNRSWGDAIPLHQGLVTDSPFDMPVRPSGANTLLAKAVDFSGNESNMPAVIVTDLGDPIVANIVETFDLHAAGFAGEITNGSISGGDLVADVLSSPLMWRADDTADFWSWNSETLMWASTMYKEMTYFEVITVSAALAGSRMTIEATVVGDPWVIEYRENSQKLMWDADESSLMWNADDATLMWDSPAWLSWPGAIEVGNTIVDVRITTGQSTTQGAISGLTVTIDAPDIEEDLNDISILAAGTRLTLTESYQVIKNVQLTVQNDGGTAITARVEDKNATLGPLVKCLDAAGSATTGLIDARVQGY